MRGREKQKAGAVNAAESQCERTREESVSLFVPPEEYATADAIRNKEDDNLTWQ